MRVEHLMEEKSWRNLMGVEVHPLTKLSGMESGSDLSDSWDLSTTTKPTSCEPTRETEPPLEFDKHQLVEALRIQHAHPE